MNNTGIYRTGENQLAVTHDRPPFWASFFALFWTPSRGGKYRWFRQAMGGRWTFHHFRSNAHDQWEGRWERCAHCPMEGPTQVYERTWYSEWSCNKDKGDTQCHCEVW